MKWIVKMSRQQCTEVAWKILKSKQKPKWYLTVHGIDVFLRQSLCPRWNFFSVGDRVDFGKFIDTWYWTKNESHKSMETRDIFIEQKMNRKKNSLFSGHVSGEPGSNFSMLIKLMFSFTSVRKTLNYFAFDWYENEWMGIVTKKIPVTFFNRNICNGFIGIIFGCTHYSGLLILLQQINNF